MQNAKLKVAPSTAGYRFRYPRVEGCKIKGIASQSNILRGDNCFNQTMFEVYTCENVEVVVYFQDFSEKIKISHHT